MDSIKEAFQKVRKDMDSLKEEIASLRLNLREINEKLLDILNKPSPSNNPLNPTNPTHNPTDNMPFKPLKAQNMPISIGNRGVPTDKQTDKQTDQHTQNELKISKNTIETASEILSSLDNIKKEIRLQFKGITEQEMLVFSTIYQLDAESGFSDYRILAQRLKLTESSIRDYVGRLIKKGIPVEKKKVNNKIIQLSISENLKKIASLSTILKLREL
jgi:hypothetical protein